MEIRTIDSIFTILFLLIMAIYFWSFFYVMRRKDNKRITLMKFNNAIISIYKNNDYNVNGKNDYDLLLEQLNLNYNKLCQDMPQQRYKSLLDILETIVYCYDTYSELQFQKYFKIKKVENIRIFLIDIIFYIKRIDPFISAPKKEADLMNMVLNALGQNNKSMGESSLKQLSLEIEYKERLFEKKEKDNQKATIVSIVGVILTFFFGLLSFIKF